MILRAHHSIVGYRCGWRMEDKVVTTSGRELIINLISLPLINENSPPYVVKLLHVVEISIIAKRRLSWLNCVHPNG